MGGPVSYQSTEGMKPNIESTVLNIDWISVFQHCEPGHQLGYEATFWGLWQPFKDYGKEGLDPIQ